ncbi:MAG: hypothetical protein ACQKBU_06010, partial [Verrucomicrobiales bacterium]
MRRPTALWATGYPRLEMLRDEVGFPRPGGLERPRIAFFSQPVEGSYTEELKVVDLSILAGLQGKADVRIRPHPREDPQELIEQLRRGGLHDACLSDAGLAADLKWCDAVASSWSTVSMEGAACGRGVFWCCARPDLYPPSQELRERG